MTTKTGPSATKETRDRESSQAKRVAESWSERVTSAVSTAVARSREELEDIWAEARRISSGKH
jgi:hypothetical protein